jgi:hypothetical protein
MHHRRQSIQESKPSLVPMADMLTNTVGIMLFILIYTVLATEGAQSRHTFPIVHDTEKRSYAIYCVNNKVFSADIDALITEKFSLKNGRVNLNDLQKTVETDEYILQGHVSLQGALSANIQITPAPRGGETIDRFGQPNSNFAQAMGKIDKDKKFLLFIVGADSLIAFQAARNLALNRGFESGWLPYDPKAPLGIVIFGGGGLTPRPQ